MALSTCDTGMSNAQRIWITYGLIVVPPVVLVLLLTAIGATSLPGDTTGIIAFRGMALWITALFIHQGIFAKCWRCKAPLHLSPLG